MTNDQNKIFEQLRLKTLNIISSLKHSQKTLKEKDVEIKELKENIKLLKEENKTLIDKYNTLKTAKSLVGDNDDSHDAKIRINKMVREIDKCIALLNS